MNKIISVARYEAQWDLRRFKTYILIAIAVISSLSFSYLVPVYAKGVFQNYSGGPESWIFAISSMFVSFFIGFVALMTGGIMTTDTYAYEFDRGTILRLLSMPLSRRHIFLGKFLEKLLLCLVLSVVVVAVSFAGSYAAFGYQGYIDWVPVVTAILTLLFMSYASIGLVISTLLRQTSLAFGILFGIWILSFVIYSLLIFKVDFNLLFEAIPFHSGAMMPSSLYSYINNPLGTFDFREELFGSSTTIVKVAQLRYLETVLISTLAETIGLILVAYALFRRARVRVG